MRVRVRVGVRVGVRLREENARRELLLCHAPPQPYPNPNPNPNSNSNPNSNPNPRTSRASSAARLMRYASPRRLLCAGRLPTPCLPRDYCCLPDAYPVPTRRHPLLTTHSLAPRRALVRRLKNHVQVRAVLRDCVDPYALEELNVDFDS